MEPESKETKPDKHETEGRGLDEDGKPPKNDPSKKGKA